MTDQGIREVLLTHGKLTVDSASLRDDDDLYHHGLTSHASINVMLALEDMFDLEFPDYLLRRATFQSVASIRAALTELGTKVDL